MSAPGRGFRHRVPGSCGLQGLTAIPHDSWRQGEIHRQDTTERKAFRHFHIRALLEWRGKAEEAVAEPKPIPVKGKSKAKTKEFTVNKQMARQGIDRLKGRYFDSSKPLLHAEVLPQSNSLPPFELAG
jgi:hypothetical protein